MGANYQDKSEDQYTFHISSPKKRRKIEYKIHSSKNLKGFIQKEPTTTQILSHKIKKTITNKIEIYKNYKNADLDDKLSHMKLNIGKGRDNPLANNNSKENNFVSRISNNESGFTVFINTLLSKFRGKW